MRVLALGGLEPTGRAGLLADVEMMRGLAAQPVGVATASTAQGRTVFLRRPVPAGVLAAQVAAALELGPLTAVKWGMVPDRASLTALTRALAGVRAPWVVDPVVASSKGEPLTSLRPRDYLQLAAPHVVVTPNLTEAAWLLGWEPMASVEEAVEAARELVARGFGAAVVKGGHQPGAAVDVVATARRVVLLRGVRLGPASEGKRGKGCRFASALAVALARGAPVEEAARTAKRAVRAYLAAPGGERARTSVRDAR